jgi:hypothetical protein
MEMPSSDWATDEVLFASLPGGQDVIDWFGFCPSFHDGTLERLELAAGNAILTVRTYRMGTKTDAEGFYVTDRKACVTLSMRGVTGVKLEGDAGSIIGELVIRRLETEPARSDWETCVGPGRGDIEIAFDTAVGLYGTIYAKELTFELLPVREDPA